MTYKEKLVKFVKLKRNHIKKFGFVYANHIDYKNIRSWPEEKCKTIFNKIVDKIMSYNGVGGLSDLTCPWCVYHGLENDPCLLCSYGKRYGKCEEKGSLYKEYAIVEVKRSLTNEIYRDMIHKINLQHELLRPDRKFDSKKYNVITYKEKLVKFVRLKGNRIKKFGFVYATYTDYKDIKSWSERRCERIYNYMVHRIMSSNEMKGFYGSTCPWCVYYSSNCASCSYSKRHGICATPNSSFDIYNTREVRESLTNKDYRDIINKIG